MVEIKEADKIVIAKPIACRPGFSNLKSFSELLSGGVNASPPPPFSETAIDVIRPKTVRFKPSINSNLVGAKAPESNVASNVVYKPIAKLVSKATVSLLANLGDHGTTREIADIGAPIQPPNQVNHQADVASNLLKASSDKKANATPENSEDNNNSLLVLPNNVDRPSYDGHNWRKYGQKQVKGSEYPRSYYKCTYPNCPVKKKVEKTLDGQIAEIVYKGEHNHPRAQLTAPDEPAQRPKRVKGHEGISENQNNIDKLTFSVASPRTNDLVTAGTCNASVSTSNNSVGMSGEYGEPSESLEAQGDEFKSKRMRCEKQLLEASTVGEASSEAQMIVPNNADSDKIGDGFRWRKYGQKVVKGKIYPRSYYRCTNPKCNVRKYVERTSEDPNTFITTYEGRHNHAMPIKGTDGETSKTSTKRKS